ncbi:hypothetical protein [Crocinitomix catalasitica]|uniref:hypothetical protein n=1 Tax=Crocinitomix catalasitica TaxID=184607 RepID=UPI00048900FD|nr:hypothetical protein [Crocinitomix catalasitica]
MKLELKDTMTFTEMEKVLSEKFPEYKVSIKKNPIFKFQFVEVAKSGTVGAWVRVFPKHNQVMVIKCIPSFWVRLFFGGLILIAFINGKQNIVRAEVGNFLHEHFNTPII